MSMHIERTLILLKPDAVVRGYMGEIISRFERAGLKFVGMKMQWVDKDFAKKHYTEDLAARRGEAVRNIMVDFLTTGPIVAICLEGVNSVEVVRKMIGSTEPKAALPGTIRGDYGHMSYAHADAKQIAVKNIIHASGDQKDAAYEVPLWFSDKELHSYATVAEPHVL
jgi:nucleoside-diphosphate kinase